MRTSMTLPLAVLVMVLVGCGKQEPAPVATMPEVNPENCKDENIAKLSDKAMQQELNSLCMRRTRAGTSPARAW